MVFERLRYQAGMSQTEPAPTDIVEDRTGGLSRRTLLTTGAASALLGAGVGVGGGTGLTDRPQLSVRNPIRRRENARRPLLRFRPILKNIRSKCDLNYCRLQGRFGVAALKC